MRTTEGSRNLAEPSLISAVTRALANRLTAYGRPDMLLDRHSAEPAGLPCF
jgi:hypothetical protein